MDEEKEFGQNDPVIADYVIDLFKPIDNTLKEIKNRSVENGLPEIQVGPMDGLHLEVITRAIGAKKAVEIGTLGGYSGVSICRGMGPEGILHTFEFSEVHAKVAAESFRKSGFERNVEIHVGPALLNLPRITKFGPFDLIFIDANKEDYPNYLRWAAENLRVGGVVLGDNTFAFGEIAESQYDKKPSVAALRAFNRECAQGGRFRSTIIPTNQGLTFGVKIK
jgi:predicted O-methyltransferase YrrM